MLARLDVGVAIFFVLSGFLLSHHFLGRAHHGTGRVPGRYFWKRFLRIYPAYLVGVVWPWCSSRATPTPVPATGPGCCSSDIYAHDTYREG